VKTSVDWIRELFDGDVSEVCAIEDVEKYGELKAKEERGMIYELLRMGGSSEDSINTVDTALNNEEYRHVLLKKYYNRQEKEDVEKLKEVDQ